MTAVLNLLVFTKRHETVSGTAFSITGSTETWNIFHIHQPFYHFIETSGIADIKLCGAFILRFFFRVTADTGTGTATNLRDTKMKHTLSAFLAFSCGDNHSGIRDCNTDTGYDFCKSIITDSICKRRSVDIIGITQTRHTDGMRTDTESCFKMFGMH